MDNPVIDIKTGGRFLVEPIGSKKVFSREFFSEDHRAIQEMIEDFSRDRILPNVQNIEKHDKELSHELLKEMGELGLIGTDIPEEYGGTDLDKITAAIIIEGIAFGGSGSFGTTFSVQTGIGSLPIIWFGTPEQKEKYLPKLVSGEWIGAYALTEPSAGSDALSGKTTAYLSEDKSYYTLNGEKCFCSNGGWADVFIVFAQVEGDKFSAFIIDKDTPGLEIGPEEKKLGMKGSSTTSLIFKDAKIPAENLLHEIGKGSEIAFNALNIGRFKLAAAELGGCKLVIEKSVEYALERRQFGQPIAHFDTIKGMVADMTIRTFANDSMIYRTIGLIDEAVNALDKTDPDYSTKLGQAMEKFAVETSMTKNYGSESSAMITDTGLQIFGGYGFIEEYPLARQYRDNRIQRIWEGTNEINRMIITGFMMKKALMEELTLREFMEDLDAFLETEIEDVIVSTLGYEAKAIEALKRLAALVFHEALCEYGQDLKHEQQLANLIADMFTLIYTAEATVCRVSQTVGSNGLAAIPIEIAKVFTVETGQEISTKVKNALNRIFKGSVPKRISEVVTKLERSLDRETDIIELKQHIADYVYKEKKYPL